MGKTSNCQVLKHRIEMKIFNFLSVLTMIACASANEIGELCGVEVTTEDKKAKAPEDKDLKRELMSSSKSAKSSKSKSGSGDYSYDSYSYDSYSYDSYSYYSYDTKSKSKSKSKDSYSYYSYY